MNLMENLGYLQWLKHECDMKDVRALPGGRWAAIQRFMFTFAIIVGRIGDRTGYDDRWCYHTYRDALHALEKWDGNGDPEGWHRHPKTGRRRDNGDPQYEYVNP